ALRDELHTKGTAAAARSLTRIAGDLGDHARALARDIGDAWLRSSDSRDLPADVTVALLRLLPASATGIVDRLVTQPSTVAAVVGARDLSPTLRGRAAAVNAERVDPSALAHAIAEDGKFVKGFHATADRATMSILVDALIHVSPDVALGALDGLVPLLDDEQRIALVLPVARRLPAVMTFTALDRHAPSGRVAGHHWAELAADALVQATLDTRHRMTPLVRVAERPLRGAETERAQRWREIAWYLQGASRSFLGRDAADAASLASQLPRRDADAAFELITDIAADRLQRDIGDWGQAMSMAHMWSGEPELDFAQRLARAALRNGATPRRDIPRWVVLWVARALEENRLDRTDLGTGSLATLSARLDDTDVERLRTFVKKRTKRGAARSWIKDNIAAAGRGLGG
ncbi:MAG: hypothetical protein M3389_11685, partial [Actinomycetota bacterium]|nr:hypothetical protein [Actinomycetota bacterium]